MQNESITDYDLLIKENLFFAEKINKIKNSREFYTNEEINDKIVRKLWNDQIEKLKN